MKNFIIFILVLMCLVLGFIFILLNTPFLVNAMVPQLINNYAKGFKIESFSCSSQRSQLPDILEMRDVHLKVRVGDELIDVQAKRIKINNFFEFAKKHELLRLSASGVDINVKNITINSAQLKSVLGLKEWKFVFTEIAWFAQKMKIGPYIFTKTDGRLKATPKKIDIFDIKGGAYGGTIVGQLDFEFDPQFTYVLWAEFNDIQSQIVKYPYPEFFKAINGGLDGTVRVVGGEQVDIFTFILQGDKGLEISPNAFLKMEGAFDEEEELELKRLAESGAVLKANKSKLNVQNSRGRKIMLIFDIEESAHNLFLKGRYSISWKEGYESFLFPTE